MSVWTGKTGTIRLDGEDLKQLRRFVFIRSEGRCERCGRGIRWHGFHLAHIKSRGAGGSDTPENTLALCAAECHLKADHNPRCVRAKV